MTKKKILYPLPSTGQVTIHKNIVYKQKKKQTFHCDVYTPQKKGEKFPCVILIQGDAPDFILKNAKDWGIFVSYGQLLASNNLAVVTFNRRSTKNENKFTEAEEDISDLIDFIQENADTYSIDKNRVVLWTFSSGALPCVRWALSNPRDFIKGVISYYGLLAGKNPRHSPMDSLDVVKSLDVPFLLVKPEKDMKRVKESNESFYNKAKTKNIPIEILRHPEGKHAFDVLNDDDKTREIIDETIKFIKRCVKQDFEA